MVIRSHFRLALTVSLATAAVVIVAGLIAHSGPPRAVAAAPRTSGEARLHATLGRRQTDLLRLAKQIELSRLIGAMRGVRSASVHYQHGPDVIGRDWPRATVSILPDDSARLEPSFVESLKNLVAWAFDGLDVNLVAVVDASSGLPLNRETLEASRIATSGNSRAAPALFNPAASTKELNAEKTKADDDRAPRTARSEDYDYDNITIGEAIEIDAEQRPAPASYGILIEDIVRVKGQEGNVLRGVGLVVGLNGTGDSPEFLPTGRALATLLGRMGLPAKDDAEVVSGATNVALVLITATLPAAGARQGDRIECQVASCGNATSLQGGKLLLSAMLGPRPDSDLVYALAAGNIAIQDRRQPLTGLIAGGCRVEKDVFSAFVKDDKITLVIDEYHRDFKVANNIAMLINSCLKAGGSDSLPAHALDATNVEVRIPQAYRDDAAEFVALLLSRRISGEDLRTARRVILNKKSETIVISGNVAISPVVISHGKLSINCNTAKLRTLLETLNSAKVSAHDVIVIIEQIAEAGKLHAKLIVK